MSVISGSSKTSTKHLSIPHLKLKPGSQVSYETPSFTNNGYLRNTNLGISCEEPYFVKKNSDSKSKYAEEDIIKMLQYLVDNISWALRERFFFGNEV